LKKGDNSVTKGQIKISSLHEQQSTNEQQSTMGDNPRRFQDHPLKTVGGAVFTRIC